MRRLVSLAALGLLFAAGPARAADAPPAGTWKLHVPLAPNQDVTFLLAFAEAGGKWGGEYLAGSQPLRGEPKLDGVAVNGPHVRFTLRLADRDFVSFDGMAAKDGKKIDGSISLFGAPPLLTELRPSKLKKLDDPFALARENLAQAEDGPALFDAAFDVLGQAAAKKLTPDEVRGIAEKATRAAGAYGPRWERAVTLRLASALLSQEGMAEVALAQARRAERMIADDDDPATVLNTLELLARGLTLAGKPDEARPFLARVAKLEARDYQDYVKAHPPFKADEFKGRAGKSDRAVLVEILSGAECPPCVAIDLAGDVVLKTYKPTEAIVLNYHYHVPGPDPLTGPDGAERVEVLARQLREPGFPVVFVDGRVGPRSGGPLAAAEAKYRELRKLIDADLEKPAGAKVALTATKQDGWALKAVVSGLEAPGDKTVLRFVLAEDRVRYKGGNGLRYHHMVVRAMPGGSRGFPLTKKAQEHTVTVDPAKVRESLAKYLDTVAKSEVGDFPSPDRPLELKALKAVAFVQNDATGEVLQAAQIDLEK